VLWSWRRTVRRCTRIDWRTLYPRTLAVRCQHDTDQAPDASISSLDICFCLSSHPSSHRHTRLEHADTTFIIIIIIIIIILLLSGWTHARHKLLQSRWSFNPIMTRSVYQWRVERLTSHSFWNGGAAFSAQILMSSWAPTLRRLSIASYAREAILALKLWESCWASGHAETVTSSLSS